MPAFDKYAVLHLDQCKTPGASLLELHLALACLTAHTRADRNFACEPALPAAHHEPRQADVGQAYTESGRSVGT